MTEFGFSEEQKNIIRKELPPQLIKTRSQAGKNLSYVTGATVTELLNDAFNYMWSWSIDEKWISEGYEKGKGKYVAHVIGTITAYIRLEDGEIVEIKKTAPGSKVIIGGISSQDSIFKAASTDALKKAASLFGIGLDLWKDEEEKIYFDNERLNADFERAWTNETKKEYEEELKKLSSYNKELGALAVTRHLSSITNGELADLRQVTPDNIKFLLNSLDNKYKKKEVVQDGQGQS